jgi:hypothetical protein
MRRIAGGTYTGVATAWQRRAVQDAMSMVVELPGVVTAEDARRHADAVAATSAMLRDADARRSR